MGGAEEVRRQKRTWFAFEPVWSVGDHSLGKMTWPLHRVPDETLLQPFSLNREVSLKRRSASMAAAKQRGAVMVAFMPDVIYQQSRRKYLAAVRKYQRRWT